MENSRVKLFFLTVGMFAVGNSSFMIAGLLPKIGQTIGQPISIASQGITAFSLTYLFSAPFFSIVFANKSAKRLLQIALTVFLLGNLVTFLSGNLGSFIIGRVITALGAGIFNPLCVSVAIQLAGESAKGKTLSLIWGANSAGVVFGVPLGIYLSSRLGWQYSIAYVFTLGLIALLGLSRLKADSPPSALSSRRDRLLLLADKNVLAVIGISCFTALASLGLYSYVSQIQAGAPNSLAISLFFWGLGGFTGSSLVGFFVDRTKNPRGVLVFILMGLTLTFATLPFAHGSPFLSLLSFFFWGAFGWATTTPQQHVLFEMHGEQRTVLSALNSSALGLGNSLGTAMGGVVIASGFKGINLPFLAATVLVGVIICQILLIKKTPLRGAM